MAVLEMNRVAEEMWRRQQQFLMHSYVYYVLDDNLIPDPQYDWLCKRLVELMDNYPGVAADLPYTYLCQGLDDSGSGYYIKDYPPQIRTVALRSLWMDKKRVLTNFNETFPEFITRWGFSLEALNGTMDK